MIIIPFAQSWLAALEPDFHPGKVQISWNDEKLQLLAELIDEELITTATENQQRLWEKGDVVEFFVQLPGQSGYYEYQISPNGLTLALFYPDLSGVAEIRSGTKNLDDFLTHPPPDANAWKTDNGWNARIILPLPAAPGSRLRVSCGRYDAGTGRAPIISSTSPHPVRDFHRPQEWMELRWSDLLERA